MGLKTLKVKEDTYDIIQQIKTIDEYKSVDAVIKDLINRVPQKDCSVKEAPAWEWTVKLEGRSNPETVLTVSWEELRHSEIGETWKLKGINRSYEATVLFKDSKGVFIRFGMGSYDDPVMDYYTQYYHFIY